MRAFRRISGGPSAVISLLGQTDSDRRKQMREAGMGKRVTALLALCFLAWSTAWAQPGSAEKAPMYTYVSTWTVPRAMWADYQKVENSDDEVMSKEVADGTLMVFGELNGEFDEDARRTPVGSRCHRPSLRGLETLGLHPGKSRLQCSFGHI